MVIAEETIDLDTRITGAKLAALNALFKYGCFGNMPASTAGSVAATSAPSGDDVFIQRIKGGMYFPSIANFVDPYELKPIVVSPQFFGKEFELEAQEVAKRIAKSMVPHSSAEILQEARRKVRWQINEPQEFQNAVHRELQRSGVFSLTDSVTNTTLWKHFAGNGSGYVIQYDPHALFEFVDTLKSRIGLTSLLVDVHYSEHQPVLLHRMGDNYDIDKYWFRPGLATKSRSFSNECEWRVILNDGAGKLIYLPPQVVTDIYLGWAVDQPRIDYVLSQRDKLAPHLGVHRVDSFGNQARKFE